MLGNLGSAEVIIIAVVLLVLFGTKKLNELAKGLGEASKEVRKIKDEFNNAVELEDNEEE